LRKKSFNSGRALHDQDWAIRRTSKVQQENSISNGVAPDATFGRNGKKAKLMIVQGGKRLQEKLAR
jgi:hypothetical protein